MEGGLAWRLPLNLAHLGDYYTPLYTSSHPHYSPLTMTEKSSLLGLTSVPQSHQKKNLIPPLRVYFSPIPQQEIIQVTSCKLGKKCRCEILGRNPLWVWNTLRSTVSPHGFRIIYLKLLSISQTCLLQAPEVQWTEAKAWLIDLRKVESQGGRGSLATTIMCM